jgi:hypothetical protein
MGKVIRTPLDRKAGERLLALFESEPEWFPTEVPWQEISSLGLARTEETISVWISGSSTNPQMAYLVNDVIAGIDVLTLETKPQLGKNEPSGNAYHYFLKKINREDFPFMLYGPCNSGTRIEHWFDDNSDFNMYIKPDK